MPIFEFRCLDCKKVTEVLTDNRDEKEITCECGGDAKKIMSTGSFRGEGDWRLPKW